MNGLIEMKVIFIRLLSYPAATNIHNFGMSTLMHQALSKLEDKSHKSGIFSETNTAPEI